MRFIDHILDDQVIDEAVVKIVLPEGAKSVYLDVAGSVHVVPWWSPLCV